MRRSPRVTVVIPARNAARFIAEALESVRAQDFAEFEAVVVDDGSSDGTFEIASRFASEDERFSVIPARWSGPGGAGRLRKRQVVPDTGPARWSGPGGPGRLRKRQVVPDTGPAREGPREAEPVGPGPARNVGVRRSRAELVAFLDADDTWLSQRLGSGVETLERNPDAGLAYGLAVETDESGQALRDEEGGPLVAGRGEAGLMPIPVRYVLWPKSVAISSTIMVRRDLALEVGGFEPGLLEDWGFNLKVAAFSWLHYTPEIIATHRRHPAGRSQAMRRGPDFEGAVLLGFYWNAIRWLRRIPRWRRLARHLAAEHLPACIVRASTTRGGRVRRARLLLKALRAMWEFPSLAFSPHTLRVPLALLLGGAGYRLARRARDRIAPGVLFPGR